MSLTLGRWRWRRSSHRPQQRFAFDLQLFLSFFFLHPGPENGARVFCGTVPPPLYYISLEFLLAGWRPIQRQRNRRFDPLSLSLGLICIFGFFVLSRFFLIRRRRRETLNFCFFLFFVFKANSRRRWPVPFRPWESKSVCLLFFVLFRARLCVRLSHRRFLLAFLFCFLFVCFFR